MKTDATLAREFADADHLAEIERLAGHAAHRRLDRDHADRHRDASLRRAHDLRHRLLERKGCAAGRERHQVEAAQLLRAVALIVEEMAFALYHHAPAIPRQEPQGQVVGEGAGRHKDRGLLASSAAMRASSSATTPSLE